MVTAATLSGVTKVFGSGDNAVRAVANADLEIRRGEMTALIGASGSGKSTLLALLVGWDRPDAGQVTVRDAAGRPTHPRQLGWEVLAVMPQALGLLEDLSMRDNVLLPARARRRANEFAARADALCERLGVAHLADRRPGQTSLGEQQRVCLARTLLLTPRLVVVDEPSAHQDRGFVDIMIETLRNETARGAAVLLATHNPDMTARSDRVVRMSDGRLTEESA